MNELKLPEPDTHCLDDEGGRPIDVWSYSPELVRQIVAADRALQSARHREELLAYEVTVGNLRAPREQAQPERKPMTDGEKLYAMWHSSDANDLDDFLDGWRHAEAFHGIKERP